LANNNEQIVTAALIRAGATPQGARGIVASMKGESFARLDPTAGSLQGHYGIAQWGGSRIGDLQNFAKQTGGAVSDINTQAGFLVHELQNNKLYAPTWAKATDQNATALDTMNTHVANFERPGGPATVAAAQATRAKVLEPAEQAPTAAAPAATPLPPAKPADIVVGAPSVPLPPARPADVGAGVPLPPARPPDVLPPVRPAGVGVPVPVPPARPAGFGFGNISGQVSDIGAPVPRAESGPMTPGPLPVPPAQPYTLPPAAAPDAPLPPVNPPPWASATGPRGSGDVVARPNPMTGYDPNMPVVPGGLGPTTDPNMNAIGDWRPQLHGLPAGYRSVMDTPPPPSQQDMLANALAQPSPAPQVDPAMLALALQNNGGAPNFSDFSDFSGGFGGFDFG
jgi:hypothetical protein